MTGRIVRFLSTLHTHQPGGYAPSAMERASSLKRSSGSAAIRLAQADGVHHAGSYSPSLYRTASAIPSMRSLGQVPPGTF